MNIPRRMLVALMMMLVLVATSGQPTTLAQSANLLTNPSFEDPFEQHLGNGGGGYVAHGWQPWFFNDAGSEFDGPEYKQATVDIDPTRVRSGFNAQQYFRDWAKHLAGVYQVVNVPAGAQLRFTIYGHAWSSFCDTKKLDNIKCDVHNSAYGDGINPMAMRIGIDPTGGTDPFSPHIIWSASRGVYDQYQQFAVEATAQGSRVTIFTLSAPEWPSAAINVYWDDAALTATGGDPNFSVPAASDDSPEEEEEQVDTAADTGTTTQQQPSGNVNPAPPPVSGGSYHEVLPGETLLGIAITYNVSVADLMALNSLANPDSIYYGQQLLLPDSARSTESLPDIDVDEVDEATAEEEGAADEQATNQLCLLLFDDLDLDGQRQPQEPLLPDGTFEVGGAVSETYTTDAESEPYCLTDLSSGDYTVGLEPPEGYAFAGLTEFPVTLSDGSRVSLSFGVIDRALLETVEPFEDEAAIPEAAAPSTGFNPVVIGIGLGGVLLLVGGISGIVLARRRWLLNREIREAERNTPRIDTAQWQSIVRDADQED